MKPGWTSKCERRAIRAVSRLNDSSELVQAAIYSPCSDVRLAAVERLDDDAALLEVLRGSRDCYVHEAAVRRVKDASRLIPYACGGLFIPARCIAVERISDQGTLQALILSDPCGWIRETAMKHVADQQFLADVALGMGDRDIPARVCAVRHITQEPAARRVYEAIAEGVFGDYSSEFSDALADGSASPEQYWDVALAQRDKLDRKMGLK